MKQIRKLLAQKCENFHGPIISFHFNLNYLYKVAPIPHVRFETGKGVNMDLLQVSSSDLSKKTKESEGSEGKCLARFAFSSFFPEIRG